MKLITCAAVAAACAVAVPASAAVTYTTYNISFIGGTSVAAPPAPRTAPGEYQDTYVFDLASAGTLSGSFSTQRLRDPSGMVVSDLDFGNSIDGVSLDGATPFAKTGDDANETVNLGTAAISAGTHNLVVNYTVDVASPENGATYAGSLNFASGAGAVPEPATWAMFVGAFGMVGASLRQRRAARVSFAA